VIQINNINMQYVVRAFGLQYVTQINMLHVVRTFGSQHAIQINTYAISCKSVRFATCDKTERERERERRNQVGPYVNFEDF
jgi:hypothetical protein